MADEKEEFSGRSEGPRIYGASDDSNRQPPPEQGLRGEQGADLGGARPDLTRSATAGGRTLTVEESSGSAFAEASGRAGPEAERKKADDDAG